MAARKASGPRKPRVAKSPEELADQLRKKAWALQTSVGPVMYGQARRGRDMLEGQIKHTVPDLDMSGLSKERKSGKRGSGKVGVVLAKPKGAGRGWIALRAVGPLHWLESGTRAHLTGAGRVSKTKTSGRAYRKAQGAFMKGAGFAHPVRGPLWHPGARAQHTWSRSVRAVQREVMTETTEQFMELLVRDD